MTVNAANAGVSLPGSAIRSSFHPYLPPSRLPPSRSPFLPSLPRTIPLRARRNTGRGGREERRNGLGRRNAWAEGEGRGGIARVAGLQHPSERRSSPCHFLAIRRNVETVPFNDLRVTKCCHSEPPKDAPGPARVDGAPVKGARAAGQVQIPDGRRMHAQPMRAHVDDRVPLA